MTKKQYDLVKVFLDVLKVPAKRLADEWFIPLSEIAKVQNSLSYDYYMSDQRPGEDMLQAMGI